MSKESMLIDPSALNPAEIFVPNGTDKLIKIVESEIDGFQGDVSTEEGRKEIYHLDRKIASSKAAINKLRLDYTADVRQKLSDINDEGKKFVERMEELQCQVSRPLDEWKAKEKSRVEALTERLNKIKDQYEFPLEISSGELIARRALVNDYYDCSGGFDWQDFLKVAGEERDKALSLIDAKISQVKAQEEQAAELEKLRKEAAERAKKDEDERLRKEGEERARRELEEKAERDRKSQEDAIRAEQERAAKAESDKIAAEKAAQEARDNAEKQAKEAAEKARLEEIARQEEESARIKTEKESRERDKKHRAKINNEAVSAIVAMDFEEEDAKELITAIAKGKIPNVKIHY